jgi:hypothetical protein
MEPSKHRSGQQTFFHFTVGWYDKFFLGIFKAWKSAEGFLQENPFVIEIRCGVGR